MNSEHPVRTPEDAVEAVVLIRRVLSEEGADASGDVDFGMARTAETILKARPRELQLAERRKQLVPLTAVQAHVEQAFVQYRQAIQRMPSRYVSQMAAEFGCEPARLQAGMDRMIAETLAEMSGPVVRP